MSLDERALPHGVELTWLGYTAQLVNSTIVERESCARRPGARTVLETSTSLGCASPQMRAATWTATPRTLEPSTFRRSPSVDAASELKPERGSPCARLLRTSNRSTRALEDDQQSVACSVDLQAVKGDELLLDLIEQRRQQVLPSSITQLHRPRSRPGNIQKERFVTKRRWGLGKSRRATGQEFLNRGDDAVEVLTLADGMGPSRKISETPTPESARPSIARPPEAPRDRSCGA